MPAKIQNEATVSYSSGDAQQGVVGKDLSSPVVFKLTNSKGKPLSNTKVFFRVTSGGGSTNPAFALTGVDGIVSANWRLGTVAGAAQTLEITGIGNEPMTYIATAVADVPALITLSGPASSASGVCSTAIEVTRFDQYGNLAAPSVSTFVNLGGLGAGAVYEAATCTGMAVSGVMVPALQSKKRFYFRSSVSQIYALSAATNETPTVNHSILVPGGAAATLTIQSGNNQTGVVGAGLGSPLVARVEDSFGNPISGTVVSFTVTAGAGAVSVITGTSAANGLVSANWTLGTVAGAPQTVQVSSVGVPSVNFTATAIADLPAKLTYTGAITSVAGVCGTAINIYQVDQYDNPATSVSPLAVTLGGHGTANHYAASDCSGAATTSLSIPAGSFAGAVYLRGATAGTYNLTATATGLTPGARTYTITPAAAALIAKISGDTQTAKAGDALPSPLVGRVEDALGNPVTGVAVTFTVSTGGGSVSVVTGTSDAAGLVSGNWTLGTVAGSGQSLTVSATGLTPAVYTATVTEDDMASFLVSGPATAVSGVCSAAYTFSQIDQYSNPAVESSNTVISLSGQGSGNFYTANDCSGAVATSAIILAGSSSTTLYFRASPAGAYNYTFQSAPFTDVLLTTTINSATATAIVVVSGNNQTGTVGSALAQPIVARVEDASNNPVPGVTVTFVITSGGGSRTIVSALSNASGQVSANWTLGTNSSQAQTLSVDSAGLTSAVFSATALTGAPSIFTMSGPASVAATVCSTAITVTRTDQYGNLAGPASATTANLAGQGTGSYHLLNDCSDGAATSVSIASGTSSSTIYFKAAASGNYTLTSDQTAFTQGTHSIAVAAGAATVIAKISGDAQTAEVGQALASSLVGRVEDASGNPISGVTVFFGVTAGGGSRTPTSVVSNALGLVSTSWTLGTVAGASQTLDFTAPGLTTASFTATATPEAPTKLRIAGPASSVAGVCATGMTITAVDQFNNPSNVTAVTNVVLSGDGAGDYFLANDCSGAPLTNFNIASGNSAQTFYFRSNTTGNFVLRGDATGFTTDGVLNHTVNAAAASTIAVSSGNNQTANKNSGLASTIVAIVRDSFSNPVSGFAVTFTITTGGGSRTVVIGTTGSDGLASANWTLGSLVGAQTLTASGAGASSAVFTATALEIDPTKLIISGASSAGATVCSAALTVERQDATSTPANTGYATVVTLAGAGSGFYYLDNTCTGSTVTSVTIPSGATQAMYYYKNASSGPYTLTASSGVLTPGSQAFSVTAGSATVITKISGDAQSAVVGTALTNPLVGRVEDGSGNPISGVTVNFAITTGGGTRSVASAVSDAGGLVSVNWTLGTGTGAQSLTFSSGVLTPAVFTATATASAPTYLTMTGAAAAASGVCSGAITVSRYDVYNNLSDVASATAVTLSGNGAGTYHTATDCLNASTTSLSIAAGTSSSLIYYRNNTAGSYTLAADTGVLTQGTLGFTVTAGSATAIAIVSGNAQSGTVGTTLGSALVGRVVDASSNPISGVTVTFTITTGGGSRSAASAVSDAAGLVSVNWTLGTGAGAQSLTFSSGALTPAVFTATATAGAPTYLTMTGSTSAASGVCSGAITVSRFDVYNNPSDVAAATAVTLSGNGAGTYHTAADCSSASTTSLNIASGTSSSLIYYRNNTAGAYTLAANSGVLTQGTLGFTVTAGAATAIAKVSGDTQTGPVGTALASPLVGRVVDASSNPIAGVTVTFTNTTGGGSRSVSTAVSDAAGLVSVNWTLGTVAGTSHSLTFSSGALTPAVFTATATAGAPTYLTMTGATTAASGVCPGAITVSRYDVYNNLSDVASATPVTLSGNGAGTYHTAADCSNASTTSLSIASGTSSSLIYYRNATAGSYTLTSNSGGLTGGTLGFTVTAGAATMIAKVSGDAQPGTVGTALGASLVGRVVDASSNPISGVTVTFTNTTGGGSRSVATAVSDAAGLVSVNWTLGTVAGTSHSLTFSSGALTSAVFTATATAGAPAQLEITGPNTVAAGVCTSPFGVFRRDTYGNLSNAASVTTVNLSGQAGGTFHTDSACSSGSITTLSIASGFNFATFWYKNSTAGSYTLQADATGLTLDTHPLTVTAGAATSIAKISGDAQSGQVTANLTNPLVGRVVDAGGNPVSGVTVTFTNTSGGGSTNIATAVSDASGIVQVTWRLGNSTAASHSLTFSSGALTPAVFTATPRSLPSTSLAMTGANTAVSGVCSGAVTITRYDNEGNPGDDAVVTAVTLSGQGTGTYHTAADCSSGSITTINIASGAASTVLYYRNNTAGSFTLTSAASMHTNGTRTFTVTAGPATAIAKFSGDAQTGMVGTVLGAALVGRVVDANSNPVSGVTVNFANTTGGGSRSVVSAVSDAAGLVSVNWTLGTVAGTSHNVTFSSGVLTSAVFTATANAGAPTYLTMTGSNSAIAGVCSGAITVSRYDTYNNLSNVASATAVTLSGHGTGSYHIAADCSSGAVTALSIASGTSSSLIYYKNNTADTYTLASNSGILTQGTLSFIVSAGTAATISMVSGDTQTGVIGSTLAQPLLVVVRDVNSNPVPGFTVFFTVTTGGGSLSLVSGLTAVNGQISSVWTLGNLVGTQQITVSGSGVSIVIFNATATDHNPTKLVLSGSTTIGAGLCLGAVTVQRQDASNVPTNSASALTVNLGGAGTNGFFYTNSVCTGATTTSVVIASGTSSQTFYYANKSAGSYTLTADAGALTQGTHAVTISGLASVFAFDDDIYDMHENAQFIGNGIQISRTVNTITHEVTVTAEAISANTTSDLVTASLTVTFLPGETSKTIPGSSLGIQSDGLTEGDERFRLKLSAPTNLATIGTRTSTIVNLIDASLTENLFFKDTLVTSQEFNYSAYVEIHRTGAMPAETVEVHLVDGTATAPGSFSAGFITVNLPLNQSSVGVDVLRSNNGTADDSRSFYLELRNPSVSKLRQWSMAKVLIIDDDETGTCNLGGSPFGGGSGTVGSPYLICTLAHLYSVRSYLTSNFRLKSDLDLDPSLDADPGTAGVQPFTPTPGIFTGSFNGDEHVLSNFRYTQPSASPTIIGLFNEISATATVSNLNLESVFIKSTQTAVHVSALIGKGTGGFIASNNYVDGYVEGTSSAAGILSQKTNNTIATLDNNFVTGHIYSPGHAGGVLGGIYATQSPVTMTSARNVATIKCNQSCGGVFGFVEFMGNMSVHILNAKSFGPTFGIGVSSFAGGIAGMMKGTTSADFRITNAVSKGLIVGGGNTGGIAGFFWCNQFSSFCSVSNNTVDRTIFGGAGRAGGLAGELVSCGTTTISNNTLAGSISVSADSAGGLAGFLESCQDVGTIHVLNNNNSTVNLTTTGAFNHIGGLIGELGAYDGDSLIRISNSTVTATITAPTSRSVGGIVGWNNINFDSMNIEYDNLTYNGAITADYYVGGIVGSLTFNTGNTNTATVKNSTANVTLNTNAISGGLVGHFLSNATGAGYQNYLTIENNLTTGTLSSTGGTHGGFIGEVNLIGTDANVNIYDNLSTLDLAVRMNSGGFIGDFLCNNPSLINADVFIERNAVAGDVVATFNTIGGFMGNMIGKSGCFAMIRNNFARNNVVGDAVVAGFIGEIDHATTGHFNIVNSYAYSTMTHNGFGGGFVMRPNPTRVVVTNSYWLKDATVQNSSGTGSIPSLNLAQFEVQINFSGWDFTTIWFPPSSGTPPALR